MIFSILKQMFKLEDLDQRAHFFGWLQIAEECVRT